jgi:SAM-dependent methyltransferase
MKSLKEQFIVAVVEEATRKATPGTPVRVLDLGCGDANYVAALVEQFPDIEYVGVEPIKESFERAKKNLANIPRAKIHFQLGYDTVPDEADASFDVVFSLSVLEHIKQLKRFIALSARYARSGGIVVHRYDLGHALHTHSLKEWIHVLLGNHFPNILPERQFVRYVPEEEVRKLYKQCGITPTKTTYHQMPSHKALEKYFKNADVTVVKELFEWEMRHQEHFKNITLESRENLFPAIAVWGEKGGGAPFARP